MAEYFIFWKDPNPDNGWTCEDIPDNNPLPDRRQPCAESARRRRELQKNGMQVLGVFEKLSYE